MRHFNRYLTLTTFAISILFFNSKSNAAEAGLFIEPSVTYESGTTDVNYPSPFSNSSGDLDGFGLGARLGLHVSEVFFLGLDARYSIPKFTDSSVSYDAESKAMNWGPVFGMQMPIVGLRIWGSNILGAELDPEQSNNLDVKFTEGTGFRLGAGFHLTAVSLNLEYQQVQYDSTDLQKLGPFSTDSSFSNVELESKQWIASVSFPIEF